VTDYKKKADSKRKYFIRYIEKERPGGPVQGTYCPAPCGKRRFGTRKEARKAARRMQSDGRHEVHPMHAYVCDLDETWFHLTSMPAATVEFIRERKAEREQRGTSTGNDRDTGPGRLE
jgi:hypothetical protein